MGELVKGKYKLRIDSVSNRGRKTDRYLATVMEVIFKAADSANVKENDIVSVKFVHKDLSPKNYVGSIGTFDGDENDIETNSGNVAINARNTKSFSLPLDLTMPNQELRSKIMTSQNILKTAIKLLETKKQIILQGAPGVGKTYATKELAVRIITGIVENLERQEIIDYYRKCVEDKKIVFSTFHQSMDYEDFIEGYKPNDDEKGGFILQEGPFKKICDNAHKDNDNNYILIIDEINRGNVSKIFGELITLLETDKRSGEPEEVKVNLTYSHSEFSVPQNLYIIGTMNTADRSLGQIDYALRRRFAFYTIKSSRDELVKYYAGKSFENGALALFDSIEKFLQNHVNTDIDAADIMIGHSYFMAQTPEELEFKRNFEIIPLMDEYRKDGIINASKEEIETLFAGKSEKNE